MTHKPYLVIVVAGAVALTAACSKPASNTATAGADQTPAASNMTDAANTPVAATSASASPGTDASGSNTGGMASNTLDKVQDATSRAVGMASAAAPTDPQGFVTAAAISDMYEQQAAKIAEDRSTSPEVKQFAQKMIHDHGSNSSDLQSILKQGDEASLTLPTQLDQRRQGLIANLKSASATDFDKTYLNQQVASHDEAETLMRGYSQHGDNGALKQFAAKSAPVIQHHLDLAKTLNGSAKFTPVSNG